MPNERGAYDFLQLKFCMNENKYLPLKWLMNVTHIITIEIPNKCDANVFDDYLHLEYKMNLTPILVFIIWIQTECNASDYSSMKYQLNDMPMFMTHRYIR